MLGEIDRYDLAGVGRRKGDVGARATGVAEGGDEERVARQHASGSLHQIAEETFLLVGRHAGLHVDAVGHVEHGAGFGEHLLIRVERDHNGLHLFTDEAVVDFVALLGHGGFPSLEFGFEVRVGD